MRTTAPQRATESCSQDCPLFRCVRLGHSVCACSEGTKGRISRLYSKFNTMRDKLIHNFTVKAHANKRNIVGRTTCSTFGPNMLRPFERGTTMLALVAYGLKPAKFWAQQVPQHFYCSVTGESVAQQCCAPFAWNHNNIGPRENVCACALQSFFRITVPECIASFRQPPTISAVVAFVCMHHTTSANNSQHCWANNVVTCCVRLHGPLNVVKLKVFLEDMSLIVLQFNQMMTRDIRDYFPCVCHNSL